MVLFGCGAVAVTTLFGSHQGLFQIGIIWGVAIMLAPVLGGLLASLLFTKVVEPAMKRKSTSCCQ